MLFAVLLTRRAGPPADVPSDRVAEGDVRALQNSFS